MRLDQIDFGERSLVHQASGGVDVVGVTRIFLVHTQTSPGERVYHTRMIIANSLKQANEFFVETARADLEARVEFRRQADTAVRAYGDAQEQLMKSEAGRLMITVLAKGDPYILGEGEEEQLASFADAPAVQKYLQARTELSQFTGWSVPDASKWYTELDKEQAEWDAMIHIRNPTPNYWRSLSMYGSHDPVGVEEKAIGSGELFSIDRAALDIRESHANPRDSTQPVLLYAQGMPYMPSINRIVVASGENKELARALLGRCSSANRVTFKSNVAFSSINPGYVADFVYGPT